MSSLTSLLAVLGTGQPSTRHDSSREHLLNQIASSVPAHLRGTPQEDFDCHWRGLAMEWAPKLQPWLNATQQRQLFDSLELSTMCGKAFVAVPSIPRAVDRRVAALTIYVDPAEGSDSNPGTIAQPLATIGAAVSATRRARAALASGTSAANATIALRGGTYYLNQTIELDARDSGLTIAAHEGEVPVVSGGVPLSGLEWKAADGMASGVYVASLAGYALPQGVPALHHRGQRATLARYPDANPELDIFPLGYIDADTAWLPPKYRGKVCNPDVLCGESENKTIAVDDAWHGKRAAEGERGSSARARPAHRALITTDYR